MVCSNITKTVYYLYRVKQKNDGGLFLRDPLKNVFLDPRPTLSNYIYQ